MRLDEFLVFHEYFSTRTKAQRAIRAGYVIVNGKISRKPGYRVDATSRIEVTSTLYEKPLGYFKLKYIDSHFGDSLFEEGTTLLDIGSSAGGFVLYALDKGAAFVLGIEVSRKFKENLMNIKERYSGRVDFIFGNAVDLYTRLIQAYTPFDIITCDVTADPHFTFSLVELYSSALAPGGHFIFTLKLPKPYYSKHAFSTLLERAKGSLFNASLNLLKVIPAKNKQELYLVASKEYQDNEDKSQKIEDIDFI